MTKSLTEKWKDGELEDDVYYVKFYTTNPPHIMEVGTEYLETLSKFNGTDRAEVLAPVPSYEEWKRLQEQLDEANEVIQKDFDSFDYIHSHIGSNQSNYNALMSATSYAISDIRKYLNKWGVK